MNLSKTQKAILALIIANTIWGAASPIFKWSLEGIHPFTLAFLRFGIAAIFLLPFVYRDLKVEKKDFMKIFLMAFFGITINITFFFFALKDTVSINAPIIGSSAPVFIIFFSILFLKEHPRTKTLIGGLIGLLGVLVIIVVPIIKMGFTMSTLGNLFLILATFGSIGHLLIAKKICDKYDPLKIVFYSFIIGALTFTPLFLGEVKTFGLLSQINLHGIIGIVFGAVFSSAVAFSFYHWSIKYLPASEVGIFIYLDPIIAVAIAIPLLGEIPTPTYLIGSLLVFLGIYIAEGRIHYHPFHRLK